MGFLVCLPALLHSFNPALSPREPLLVIRLLQVDSKDVSIYIFEGPVLKRTYEGAQCNIAVELERTSFRLKRVGVGLHTRIRDGTLNNQRAHIYLETLLHFQASCASFGFHQRKKSASPAQEVS